jgi:hypothetical protein
MSIIVIIIVSITHPKTTARLARGRLLRRPFEDLTPRPLSVDGDRESLRV